MAPGKRWPWSFRGIAPVWWAGTVAVQMETTDQVRSNFKLAWLHTLSPLCRASGSLLAKVLGAESSLCPCQGHTLQDGSAADGLWNSGQDRHWTVPWPPGFLEPVQRRPFINNSSSTDGFSSEHRLAVTTLCHPSSSITSDSRSRKLIFP